VVCGERESRRERESGLATEPPRPRRGETARSGAQDGGGHHARVRVREAVALVSCKRPASAM